MGIEEIIKKAINDHKYQIQYYQWAFISGVSTLVYSEFISRIREKDNPKRMYLVPTIRSVYDLLDPHNQFMTKFSDEILHLILTNEMFIKYSKNKELELFSDENIELLKVIIDIYIIPNIFKMVPLTIRKKFNLDDENNQLIIESNEIDLFDRKPISDLQIKYLADEIVLHLLMLLPNIEKNTTEVNSNNFHLKENEILTFGSQTAITPIHMNYNVLKNQSVIDLFSFVTNSKFVWMGDYYSIMSGDKLKKTITVLG